MRLYLVCTSKQKILNEINFITNFCRLQTERLKDHEKHTLINHLTVGQLLRSGVDGLPAAVALGQVGPCHPDVVPHVKVPDGVCAELGVVPGGELAAVVAREELVDCQTGVGVVRRDEVGHGAAREAEGPAH